MRHPAFNLAEEVKARVDLVELAGDHTELRRRGAEWSGACPFPAHDDRSPSFSVNQEKQVFHCYGCGASGDVFSLVQGVYGIGFREALEMLAERAGVKAKSRLSQLPPKVVHATERREPECIPGRYSEVLEAAFGLYQQAYAGSAGEAYLEQERGVHAEEAGWSPGGKFLLRHGLNKDILLELGLIYGEADSAGVRRPEWKIGSDTMAHRVILPYRWEGKTTCLYGRASYATERLKHLYTRTSAGGHEWLRGVFNEAALVQRRVVIVEAAIDALAVQCVGTDLWRFAAAQAGRELSVEAAATLGEPQAVAIGGTHNPLVMDRIAPDARILVAVDSDQAGEMAAREWLVRFPRRAGRVVPPGGCKDWGELVMSRAGKGDTELHS